MKKKPAKKILVGARLSLESVQLVDVAKMKTGLSKEAVIDRCIKGYVHELIKWMKV